MLRDPDLASRRPPVRADLAVDLAARIGSAEWFCGAVTLAAGIAALVALSPGVTPLPRLPGSHITMPVPNAEPSAARAAPVAIVTPPPAPRIGTGPLRIAGPVGFSLYHAARTAGVPLPAIGAYLRAIGTRIDVGEVRSTDRFDLVIERRRDADGRIAFGKLLYAGLEQPARRLSLLAWNGAWYDADGAGAPRDDGFVMPVAGHATSGFGMRIHPILGYGLLHRGIDLAAPYGAPIVAASDGVVRFAGRHGGHGDYVLVAHPNGLESGYGHMSRIVATPGASVRQGELIGYVGSSGLSTGPHLHFEIFRGGVAIDPATATFDTVPHVPAGELDRFRRELARVTAIPAEATVPR